MAINLVEVLAIDVSEKAFSILDSLIFSTKGSSKTRGLWKRHTGSQIITLHTIIKRFQFRVKGQIKDLELAVQVVEALIMSNTEFKVKFSSYPDQYYGVGLPELFLECLKKLDTLRKSSDKPDRLNLEEVIAECLYAEDRL